MKYVKISLIVLGALVAVICIAFGVFFILIEPDIKLPGFSELNTGNLTSYSRTVTILDKDGAPINDALYDNNKYYTKIKDLHPYTVQAFIAIEDKRFYNHSGVDYRRLASATLSNIRSGEFREGASTITQQLIKNTHLSLKKTVKRKLDEIRLARKLERIYSKNDILEGYINILYFGSGINGLGTASRVMFNKPASELTLAQSAALASIINNPSKYSPYNNPDKLDARKKLVLSEMRKQGYITAREFSDALSETITFNKENQSNYIHFVLSEACKKLQCSEKNLFAQNLTVKTSYNGKIARFVRNSVETYTDYNVRVLVLDNANGGVICDESNTNQKTELRRSPASAIKPFISYAPALEYGMTPLTFIDDSPTDFDGYSPKNYKNIYRGTDTLKNCLCHSSNIAAVKLLQTVGLENGKNIAEKFGITFSDSDNTLSVALGGMTNGITLFELANAYMTLADLGRYSKANYVSGITDMQSKTLYTASKDHTRAISEDTAYLITDMLAECTKTGTAKKLKNCGHIAAKTGTNGDANGNTDCYCIAYTPNNTIAVHYWQRKNLIPNSITGANCCDIIERLVSGNYIDTATPFPAPDSVAYYDIDIRDFNNKRLCLADPSTPPRFRQRALFAKRHIPAAKYGYLDYYDKYSWDELA